MIECDYGTIEVRESVFKWDIPGVIKCIKEEKKYNLRSPVFRYADACWRICMQSGKSPKLHVDVLRLFLYPISIDGRTKITKAYKFSVNDLEGINYWTSNELADHFENNSYSFWSIQDMPVSNLRRFGNRITSTGLYVLVKLYPYEESPHQGTSLTTDFGSQESAKLYRKPDVSSDSDGVDRLLQNLKDMLLTGKNSDVTLNVKGTEFKVHKVILAASSPVFSNMFNHNMSKQASGIVEVVDCDAEIFHTFLLYLYSGKEDTFTVNNVVELYCVADKYDVRPLAAACSIFMIQNFTVDSFTDFVSLALRQREAELLESAKSFLSENLRQIVDTQKWKEFNTQYPVEATEIQSKALSEVKIHPQ